MNIDYDEIDELCRPTVKFFNSVGLTTKFSCQGHNNIFMNQFDIIFDDDITDEDIYNFINKYSNKFGHTPFVGQFNKWMRKISGEIICNWCYTIPYGNYKTNQEFAKSDLEIMSR